MISYTVSQRTHEIGIRMALGTQTCDALRLIVGQGLGTALIGMAIGLAGARRNAADDEFVVQRCSD
jgi:putative ABC transport system permease protein